MAQLIKHLPHKHEYLTSTTLVRVRAMPTGSSTKAGQRPGDLAKLNDELQIRCESPSSKNKGGELEKDT